MFLDIKGTLWALAVVLLLSIWLMNGCHSRFERRREYRQQRQEQFHQWRQERQDGEAVAVKDCGTTVVVVHWQRRLLTVHIGGGRWHTRVSFNTGDLEIARLNRQTDSQPTNANPVPCANGAGDASAPSRWCPALSRTRRWRGPRAVEGASLRRVGRPGARGC